MNIDEEQMRTLTSLVDRSALTAGRIKHVRKLHGWSVSELSKQCRIKGLFYLTESVIANIESGRPDSSGRRRRKVTVDELYDLSAVLDVPVVYLAEGVGTIKWSWSE